MKIIIILIMISAIAVLGCLPQKPQNDTEPGTDTEAIAKSDSTSTSAYVNGTWITDYDQALQFASELKRPVLIDFTGSDWCIWCKRLEGEVFSKAVFKTYAEEKMVLLKIDFPQKKQLPKNEQDANNALAGKFNVEGFPTVVLVNSKGKEIARTGYQDGGPDMYVSHLKGLLGEK